MNVHRFAFQPLSFVPKSKFPGHSCDMIELHVSVHICCVAGLFHNRTFMPLQMRVLCPLVGCVNHQIKFPVNPDKAGKFNSCGSHVPMEQPGIRMEYGCPSHPMRGSCHYSKANHFISGLGMTCTRHLHLIPRLWNEPLLSYCRSNGQTAHA